MGTAPEIEDLARTTRLQWIGLNDPRLEPITHREWTVETGARIRSPWGFPAGHRARLILAETLRLCSPPVPIVHELNDQGVSIPQGRQGDVRGVYDPEHGFVVLEFDRISDWKLALGRLHAVKHADLGEYWPDKRRQWGAIGLGHGSLALCNIAIETPANPQSDDESQVGAHAVVQPVPEDVLRHLDPLRTR